MKKNSFGGKLIAFDGPSGTGKTTIIEKVLYAIKENKIDAVSTKELTYTDLGKFVKEKAQTIFGHALACLIAADRYEHLKRFIIPNLKKNKIILCDRYILSSLVLQQIDGVEPEFIMNINSEIIIPDHQIIVSSEEDIIRSRLKKRKNLSRFEQYNNIKAEVELYKNAYDYFLSKNIRGTLIKNNTNLQETISGVYKLIMTEIETEKDNA